VTDLEANIAARESILRSIREHLAASVPHDVVHAERGDEPAELDIGQPNGYRPSEPVGVEDATATSLVETFGKNLEAVGGHCILASNEAEVIEALNGIISSLQDSPLRGRRIALSNEPLLERLMAGVETGVGEIVVAVDPGVADLFGYDVGISTAQAAIAETGTLMLNSEAERHRLVSLVPPVHIAIVDDDAICLTLGEALAAAGQGSELSPTITFITGPSRTADIELTLAIGVHGPQELYVIINEGPVLTS
jgi:L-lactate dehydrogenase complex protein LldG